MGHELAGKLSGDEVDVVFGEGEAGTKPMQKLLDVTVGHKVPIRRG